MQDVFFKSTFTIADYKKVSYFNLLGRKWLVGILCLVMMIIGVIALIPHSFLRFSPLVGLIFIVYPIGLILYNNYCINKPIRNNTIPHLSEQAITLSEEGLVFIKNEERQEYTWNELSEIYETHEYFIVYTSKKKIVTLIKRDVDCEEHQIVRNLVVNNLSYKQYRLRH